VVTEPRGGGSEMTTGAAPWIDVPDEWVDDKFSCHNGYRAFQEYFGVKINTKVLNTFLLGHGIGPRGAVRVTSFDVHHEKSILVVESELAVVGPTWKDPRVTDTSKVALIRTFDREGKLCEFVLMSSSPVKLPQGFAREYYRRVIPLLRTLGIKQIKTSPLTTAEHLWTRQRSIGCYVWSFYGYTNDDMPGTLNEYIRYLSNVKRIKITSEEEGRIVDISRMRDLATDMVRGENTGQYFLRGMDEYGNPSKEVKWSGTHHDIFDESIDNIEMSELTEHIRL
jgi:hypothetical protein